MSEWTFERSNGEERMLCAGRLVGLTDWTTPLEATYYERDGPPPGVDTEDVWEAIELAKEAGFWRDALPRRIVVYVP